MRTDTLERSRGTTRQRILAAASQLFARDGFDATTVKQIARQCQLTDPALYYHFGSKRDILNALLVEPPLARIELRSMTEPTHDALVDDVCSVFDFWADHVALLRVLYRQALEGDADIAAFTGQLSASTDRLLMPATRQIYGPDAERIYTVITTLLTGLNLDAIIELGDEYRESVASRDFRARMRRLVHAALPPPVSREAP